MRLEPVLLLDDPGGPSDDSARPRERTLSRRALLAAAFGGGAAAGLTVWLGPSPSGADPAVGTVDLEGLHRLADLPDADLLKLHHAVAFAAVAAPRQDAVVDRIAERLLEAVRSEERPGVGEVEELRAKAALSLITLARLRGRPAALVRAIPELEAIR